MHGPWEGKHCSVRDEVEGFLRIERKVSERRLLSPRDVFSRCPHPNSCFSPLVVCLWLRRRTYLHKSWQIITEGDVCEIEALCQGENNESKNKLRGSSALLARPPTLQRLNGGLSLPLLARRLVWCARRVWPIWSQLAHLMPAKRRLDFYVENWPTGKLKKKEICMYFISPPSLSIYSDPFPAKASWLIGGAGLHWVWRGGRNFCVSVVCVVMHAIEFPALSNIQH